MEIVHSKKAACKPFKELEDLAVVSEFVRNNYNPETFNCIKVCDYLSEKYSNLVPTEVGVLIYNGAAQKGGHVVCKIIGTNMILDPVGDYANYSSKVRLMHNIEPWLFVQSKDNSDLYLSQNHMPMQFSDSERDTEEGMTDWDVLRLSGGPFYKGLRGIIL